MNKTHQPPPSRVRAASTAGATSKTQHHNHHHGASTKTDADHARELQRERERAAAREAQREHWERTRGAGSSVLALYDDEFRNKSIDSWEAEDVLPSLEEVQTKKYDPVEVPSADLLLTRGISEYTMLPKVLGRGKFSTVFLAVKNGQKYAIKHTALFPHHPLISTRLLREPTLLAELPPHPNLVTVNETIRTPGHFYLVEEYLGGYVTLEALIPLLNKSPPDQPAKLPDDVAEKVFQQLISAVNSIHSPLQICHRDIKPENILVHPVTLNLKLLDFGLATHFSRSEPKLSTCCGSPAFHCPEIVKALASPPGTVMYWGPEVDAWTCGITMLRCLTGVLYPLGAQHTSLRSMAIRAQRSVSMVSNSGLREKIGKLVDMDGVKRMRYFQEMNDEQERLLGEPLRERKEFKSTTYIPTEPSHSMRLPLLSGAAAEHVLADQGWAVGAAGGSAQRSPLGSSRTTPNTSRASSPAPLRHQSLLSPPQPTPSTKTLILLNPTSQPPQRVLSFIKYVGSALASTQNPASAAALPLSATSTAASGTGNPQPPSPPTTMTANSSSERLEINMLNNLPVQGNSAHANGLTSHIHIFQCVLHLPEPVEEPEEQLSLVQTIMAAFGRRSAPNAKRSLSQPPKPKTTDAAAASVGGEASGKAAADAANAVASGNGGKSTVRCLPFWMIIKFPKHGSGIGLASGAIPPRASYQRSSSAAGRRSRTTSTVNGNGGQGSEPATLATTRRSCDHSPDSRPDSAATPKEYPGVTRASLEIGGAPPAGAAIISRMSKSSANILEDLKASGLNRPSGERQRSGSYSRAHSRQRLRSRVSQVGPVSKPKIFLHVSDERALSALKQAFSVGGTAEASDLEEEYLGISSLLERSGDKIGTGSLRASHEEPRSPNSPVFERKARPSILRSQTLVASSTQNGIATTGPITSHTTQGLPFPSVHEDGGDDVQRGRTPGAAAAAVLAGRRLDLQRTGRTYSSASVRGLPSSSRSTLSSEDLQRKLDALQSALRPVLTRSSRTHSHNGHPDVLDNGLATVEQARLNLAGLLQMLHDAEQAQGPVLQSALSPITFQLFSVLAPVLGLESVRASSSGARPKAHLKDDQISKEGSEHLQTSRRSLERSSSSGDGLASPGQPASRNGAGSTSGPPSPLEPMTERMPNGGFSSKKSSSSSLVDSIEEKTAPTPMRTMARNALELAAQYSSAREMFLAVQERLDLLTSQAEAAVDHNGSDRADDTTPGTPALERKAFHGGARRPATKGWDGGLELEGLIRLLSIVVPRIKTRKPHNFSESLASLLPRATKALLLSSNQTRARKAARRDNGSKGSDQSTIIFRQKNALSVFRALIELTKVTNAWEIKCLVEDQKTDSEMLGVSVVRTLQNDGQYTQQHPFCKQSIASLSSLGKRTTDVSVMFFGTLASLIPYLPSLQAPSASSKAATGLSEAYFFAKFPKYGLQRPAELVRSSSFASESISVDDATDLWNSVAVAVEGLHKSICTAAFGDSSEAGAQSPVDSASSRNSKEALTSIGAFACLVQLLSLDNARTAVLGVSSPPSSWTVADAHKHLVASLPIVVAGLKCHATVKNPLDDNLAYAPMEALEDHALLWTLWCFDALEKGSPTERVLQPETAVLLVQSLSANAALSASAARLISFMLVKQIITHHTSEAVAADLLVDIVSPECPFANLRRASVGMIRDIIDLRLRKDAGEGAHDPTGVLSPSFLEKLRAILFALPPGFDSITQASLDPEKLSRMRNFLEDHTAWLSECVHTLYYLLKRDRANVTGIQVPALREQLQRTFVSPLRSMTESWRSVANSQSTTSEDQQRNLDSISTSLGVLSMSLDLILSIEEAPMESTSEGAA
ncbi:hypothetical protein OC846_004769 [Tilletia horrida]|uniref:Protein kinase domain-containing protein n=1 Tax=Tilletia horrida TaxID=155126 RepID=A0AAN6GN26_9BASI|nr:hypothetical protein OC846_004769 [Tilletia horrida]